MTSKLKCPFCGKKLVQDHERSVLSIIYRCPDDKCFLKYGCAESDIWQALIQSQQQLKTLEPIVASLQGRADINAEVARDSNELVVQWYEKYEQSQKDLKIARKALEEIDTTRCIPQHTLISLGKFSKTTRFNAGNIICVATPDYIHNILEQINRKED